MIDAGTLRRALSRAAGGRCVAQIDVRNFAIETAVQDFDELISQMSTRSFENIDILNDPATQTLVNSYGERLSSQHFHLIVGVVADGGSVCEICFPTS